MAVFFYKLEWDLANNNAEEYYSDKNKSIVLFIGKR